jgi:hypothetical protein
MTGTRRTFLSSAAAWAVWPREFWGAQREQGPASFVSLWEKPDGTATDNVMVRRLYLDLAGRIPTRREARTYVRSRRTDKREELVERLLASSDFTHYWTMRFCDILRVKSEFPINLWPNAVYVYHNRIRSFVEENESWEHFAHALLTSQGSNFRDAEVNFFRATDRRTPEGWAEAVALTFWGIPPAELPDGLRRELAGYLTHVRIKNSREWKEEIVYVDGEDQRERLYRRIFVDDPSRAIQAFEHRLAQWIFGPSTPRKPTRRTRAGGVKDVLRQILLSPEYARGSVTGGFPVRRLDAEVLDDAFCALSHSVRRYHSPAPEPYTVLPPARPTVCIEDGSITSGFLSLFGRPARDKGVMTERGLDVTAKQRLYLFNSGTLHQRITRFATPSPLLPNGKANPLNKMSVSERIDDVYWRFLSRAPAAYEREVILDLWRKRRQANPQAPQRLLLRDVAWSLMNTKEFLFRV